MGIEVFLGVGMVDNVLVTSGNSRNPSRYVDVIF